MCHLTKLMSYIICEYMLPSKWCSEVPRILVIIGLGDGLSPVLHHAWGGGY